MFSSELARVRLVLRTCDPAVLETVLENGEQVLKANVASTPRKEECT